MLPFLDPSPLLPFKEWVAYEALWAKKGTTFKSLAALFAAHPGSRPSDFIENKKTPEVAEHLKRVVLRSDKDYGTRFLLNGTFDFPEGLKDAKEPIQVLYYSGVLDFLHTPCVAVVGTRHPTEEGLKITAEIVTRLVEDDFTVVSGLAAGIDTQAHQSAIAAKGRTIAVIGTPLDTVYPTENEELQGLIAQEHLLLSQVPFYRYYQQDFRLNKLFFPERNKTMSALTEATLIVEAGETSGSLTQAAAALYQKRKLLIWDGCFNVPGASWPWKLLQEGAVRVCNYSDIKNAMNPDVPSFEN